MLNLTLDLATGKLVLVSPVPLKATSEVPVTITFSSVPSSATGLSIALGSGQTPQRTLAFNDSFSGSGATRTATLNANDTRMQAFMVGRGAATLDIEFAGVINGFIWIVHNVKVLVQAGVVTGPEASDDGPTYLTAGQVQGLIDDAVGAGAWQPLDSDLTAIAALSTTSFGRGALTDANAAAGRSRLGSVIGTDVQAFSTNLAALANNTGGTLGLTNVTVWFGSLFNTPLNASSLSSGTVPVGRLSGISPTFNQVSFTSTSTSPSMGTGHGSGAQTLELGVIANLPEVNALFVQNNDIAGFPGITFRDYQGHEVAGIGYANPSASVFAGMWGMEVSDASNAFSGLAPRFYLSQFSNFGVAGAANHSVRFTMETDGELRFYPTYGNNAGAPYITFAKINPTFLFGYAGEISLNAVSGTSEITLSGSTPRVTGTGGGGTMWVRAIDDAASIQLRDPATGRSNRYSCFGGTLGQGGHQFWTGGAYGSQVERLRISDNGVQAFVGITATSFNGLTITTTAGTLTLAGNLVTTGSFNTTFAQSGTTTVTLPATSATMARTDFAQSFAGIQTFLTAIAVASGGTGNATLAAYAPLFGGTTTTGAIQSGTVGTTGQVLTSNGAAALPTFQTPASGYALTLFGPGAALNPANSTTYYAAGNLGVNSLSYGDNRIEIPKSGTITRVSIKIRLTAGAATSETVVHNIRINDTTDIATINTTYDANTREGSATGLSAAVVAGDFIALKIVTPAWATPPTAVHWYCIVYIAT